MVSIRTTRLTKRFGTTLAVDAADVEVRAGEIFFLLGPSGCGKTTLMRMIAGLTEPSEGAVHFGDRDVTTLPTAKRNTALVFQSYALWPHMTVRQNVAFGLDVRGISSDEKQKRVEAMLQTVRLGELAERKPGQLSGGQQQRVALARALVVNPDVLLLDEPLSNLDAKLRHEMRGEIRRICTESKVTAVYVTHDQEEALSIADRIAVMRNGRIEQVGSPMEVYGKPRNRFVADFLGRTNMIPATVKEVGDGVARVETGFGTLHSGCFPADLPAGANVTCCVRPESVRIGDGAAAGVNSMTARHVQTTYLGHLAEHVFEVAGGARISVEELKPAPRDWAGEVRLSFDPADLIVLVD